MNDTTHAVIILLSLLWFFVGAATIGGLVWVSRIADDIREVKDALYHSTVRLAEDIREVQHLATTHKETP